MKNLINYFKILAMPLSCPSPCKSSHSKKFQDINIKRKAFSIAEAMLTLLIVSVFLAMTAPLFTKRTQGGISTTQGTESVPKGAIMFFAPEIKRCPDGWEPLDEQYAGRFLRVAGNYEICKDGEDNKTGACKTTGNNISETLNIGDFSGDGIRRIKGTLPGGDHGAQHHLSNAGDIGPSIKKYVEISNELKIISGPFNYMSDSETDIFNINEYDGKYGTMFDTGGGYISYVDPALLSEKHAPDAFNGSRLMLRFDSQEVVPSAPDVRPKSAAVLACKKK